MSLSNLYFESFRLQSFVTNSMFKSRIMQLLYFLVQDKLWARQSASVDWWEKSTMLSLS